MRVELAVALAGEGQVAALVRLGRLVFRVLIRTFRSNQSQIIPRGKQCIKCAIGLYRWMSDRRMPSSFFLPFRFTLFFPHASHLTKGLEEVLSIISFKGASTERFKELTARGVDASVIFGHFHPREFQWQNVLFDSKGKRREKRRI